jgi:hypothetical protein
MVTLDCPSGVDGQEEAIEQAMGLVSRTISNEIKEGEGLESKRTKALKEIADVWIMRGFFGQAIKAVGLIVGADEQRNQAYSEILSALMSEDNDSRGWEVTELQCVLKSIKDPDLKKLGMKQVIQILIASRLVDKIVDLGVGLFGKLQGSRFLLHLIVSLLSTQNDFELLKELAELIPDQDCRRQAVLKIEEKKNGEGSSKTV